MSQHRCKHRCRLRVPKGATLSRDDLAHMLELRRPHEWSEFQLKKHRQTIGLQQPVPNPMSFRPELTPFINYRGVKIQIFTFTLHLLRFGTRTGPGVPSPKWHTIPFPSCILKALFKSSTTYQKSRKSCLGTPPSPCSQPLARCINAVSRFPHGYEPINVTDGANTHQRGSVNTAVDCRR